MVRKSALFTSLLVIAAVAVSTGCGGNKHDGGTGGGSGGGSAGGSGGGEGGGMGGGAGGGGGAVEDGGTEQDGGTPDSGTLGSLSIADVTAPEGSTGTTTLSFIVTLSA